MNKVHPLIGVVCRHAITHKEHIVSFVQTDGLFINLFLLNNDFVHRPSDYRFAWADDEESETEWLNLYDWNKKYYTSHPFVKYNYWAKTENGKPVQVVSVNEYEGTFVYLRNDSLRVEANLEKYVFSSTRVRWHTYKELTKLIYGNY